MTEVRMSTKQFRALPSPVGTSKVGMFFTPTAAFPVELWNWRDVNPRDVNRRSAVYRAISDTLKEQPERFHERNRGLTIVASDIVFDDKRHEVILRLDDKRTHGVVDGAHTLQAILEAQAQEPVEDQSGHVFIKTITGVDGDQIAEIAGGLNTSQQVDLKSLENLRDHFDELKERLEGEPYASLIAYKMNENLPIDVREILYYLAVFDCTEYSDKKHPVALFGRKEGIVRRFAEQADPEKDAGDSFRTLISRAPEILALRDKIEKFALKQAIGRYKAGKRTRVRSASNRGNELLFLQETVDGKIPLGWIMPLLAAFRANIEWDKPKGSFSWIVPLDELLASCIDELVLAIKDVHLQENSRPEYVGRNTLAWRMTYSIVSNAILEWKLGRANSRNRQVRK